MHFSDATAIATPCCQTRLERRGILTAILCVAFFSLPQPIRLSSSFHRSGLVFVSTDGCCHACLKHLRSSPVQESQNDAVWKVTCSDAYDGCQMTSQQPVAHCVASYGAEGSYNISLPGSAKQMTRMLRQCSDRAFRNILQWHHVKARSGGFDAIKAGKNKGKVRPGGSRGFLRRSNVTVHD